MLLINAFKKTLTEKVKNTKNFTTTSGALFLRLFLKHFVIQQLIQKNSYKCLPVCIAKHNHTFIFNKVHE